MEGVDDVVRFRLPEVVDGVGVDRMEAGHPAAAGDGALMLRRPGLDGVGTGAAAGQVSGILADAGPEVQHAVFGHVAPKLLTGAGGGPVARAGLSTPGTVVPRARWCVL